MNRRPGHDTYTIIDLPAFGRNIRKIIDFTGGKKVMAVVKADAYGHGIAECAKTALNNGAYMLGVSVSCEAALLRDAGIEAPILALAAQSPDVIPELIDNNVAVGLASFKTLKEIAAYTASSKKKCKVHVKVDTGMGRIGIEPKKAPELTEAAFNTPGVTVEGIFSHFPSSDEEKDDYTKKQIETFKNLLSTLENKKIRPKLAHLCNSAGILKFPEAHLDMVRPGIMIYGLLPYPGSEEKLSLEPLLSFKSRVAFIKEVPAGFAVSYGGTAVTKRPSRLATAPVGYGDGFKRFLSNRGRAIINGVFVQVIGRVCMDQTVFDITDAGDVKEGDTITLIGSDGSLRITAEEHALIGGTITHEIATGITGRVSRIHIEAP
jgi:alanine racemase